MKNNKLYEEAGVSLTNGYEVISRIKKHVAKTQTPGTLGSIGGFGGMFSLREFANYEEPVLVSGTDGVGTKLLLAIESDIHNTIGQDLVAMCVNDVVTLGAKPLFFLDYFATGKLKPETVEKVVEGIANTLADISTALVGGETAEMPDMYSEGHYDLGGFTVGIVDKKDIIDAKKKVKAGDVLIALPSSGIHSNGYSLVRKIFFKDNNFNYSDKLPYNNEKTLIEELLTPTKIYVNQINDLVKNVKVSGICNITGGGFQENIPRMLSDELTYQIDYNDIKVSPIFKWMQELSSSSDDDMFNTFNMGVGMVVAVDEKLVQATLENLKSNDEDAYIIGKVVNK